MSRKTDDRVAAALERDDLSAAEYSKALEQAQTARDTAGARLELTAKAGDRLLLRGAGDGAERTAAIKRGDLDKLAALDAETDRLHSQIDMLDSQRAILERQYKAAHERECAEHLPEAYATLKSACEDVQRAHEALVKAWREADATFEATERQWIAARGHTRNLPRADDAVCAAVTSAWACAIPKPMPRMTEPLNGQTRVAEVLGREGGATHRDNMLPANERRFTFA